MTILPHTNQARKHTARPAPLFVSWHNYEQVKAEHDIRDAVTDCATTAWCTGCRAMIRDYLGGIGHAARTGHIVKLKTTTTLKLGSFRALLEADGEDVGAQ